MPPGWRPAVPARTSPEVAGASCAGRRALGFEGHFRLIGELSFQQALELPYACRIDGRRQAQAGA